MRSRADASPSWLWTATLAGPGESIRLEGDEAHHLVRVCRARVGDVISLTDGRGALARAEVESVRPDVIARVLELDREASPAPRWLACGPPEGDRADWMVEKLAELGVTVFQPVDGARASWGAGESRLARWRRLARAALGQSRSRHLMEIRSPVPLGAWLEGRVEPGHRWVGDPDGKPAPAGSASPERLWEGLVGPSPGFDEHERRSIEARGFLPIRLADSRLRTETAAVAMAAVRASIALDEDA